MVFARGDCCLCKSVVVVVGVKITVRIFYKGSYTVQTLIGFLFFYKRNLFRKIKTRFLLLIKNMPCVQNTVTQTRITNKVAYVLFNTFFHT